MITPPTKRRFLLTFVGVVVLLALLKPLVAPPITTADKDNGPTACATDAEAPSSDAESPTFDAESPTFDAESPTFDAEPRHPIRSVPSFQQSFPDSQSVQLLAADRWGVRPVENRQDAEARKQELVYVGESPYYHVDRLQSSIPYLVPRAALLLQDIGQAFYDSLYMKGVPLQQLIVTSVLRTKEDVARLQRHNGNATDNSCHLYGTTFDICYNRYHALGRPVQNDTLKWVLAEVLRDIRRDERAYIKYEVKQGCFHMTVR